MLFMSFLTISAEYVSLKLFVLNGSRVVSINYLEEWVDVFSLNRNSELGNKVGHLINGQGVSPVQVEIAEDLFQQRWVVSGKLEHSGFHLSM